MNPNFIRLTLTSCGESLSYTHLVNSCLDCLSQTMKFCIKSGNCGNTAVLAVY